MFDDEKSQSIPLFQNITGDYPSSSDDVCPFSFIFA